MAGLVAPTPKQPGLPAPHHSAGKLHGMWERGALPAWSSPRPRPSALTELLTAAM